MTGIEIVALRVIVGRRGYYHELSIAVGRSTVESCRQIEFLLGKIFFDVIILYRRLAVVKHVDLFRYYIYCRYFIMTCEKHCQRKAYIACTCYCDIHSLILDGFIVM